MFFETPHPIRAASGGMQQREARVTHCICSAEQSASARGAWENTAHLYLIPDVALRSSHLLNRRFASLGIELSPVIVGPLVLTD